MHLLLVLVLPLLKIQNVNILNTQLFKDYLVKINDTDYKRFNISYHNPLKED